MRSRISQWHRRVDQWLPWRRITEWGPSPVPSPGARSSQRQCSASIRWRHSGGGEGATIGRCRRGATAAAGGTTGHTGVVSWSTANARDGASSHAGSGRGPAVCCEAVSTDGLRVARSDEDARSGARPPITSSACRATADYPGGRHGGGDERGCQSGERASSGRAWARARARAVGSRSRTLRGTDVYPDAAATGRGLRARSGDRCDADDCVSGTAIERGRRRVEWRSSSCLPRTRGTSQLPTGRVGSGRLEQHWLSRQRAHRELSRNTSCRRRRAGWQQHLASGVSVCDSVRAATLISRQSVSFERASTRGAGWHVGWPRDRKARSGAPLDR